MRSTEISVRKYQFCSKIIFMLTLVCSHFFKLAQGRCGVFSEERLVFWGELSHNYNMNERKDFEAASEGCMAEMNHFRLYVAQAAESSSTLWIIMCAPSAHLLPQFSQGSEDFHFLLRVHVP